MMIEERTQVFARSCTVSDLWKAMQWVVNDHWLMVGWWLDNQRSPGANNDVTYSGWALRILITCPCSGGSWHIAIWASLLVKKHSSFHGFPQPENPETSYQHLSSPHTLTGLPFCPVSVAFFNCKYTVYFFLLIFPDFSNDVFVHSSKSILPDNPYPGLSTEEYGLWGNQL